MDELIKLPGIGPKSAQRLMMHFLRAPEDDLRRLSEALSKLKSSVRLCSKCFHLSEGELCDICSDSSRDRSMICVVEEPIDLLALERIKEYNGLYHVLHGAISPLDGIKPEDLRIGELVNRLRKDGAKEVILATNTNLEGETTALYIADQLKENFPSIRITRIARGLPMGGEMDYADQVTLIRALQGRVDI
jgi:recombination protein RecR